MKISSTNPNIMVFRGEMEPTRTQIIINNEIKENNEPFYDLGNYFGYDIRY